MRLLRLWLGIGFAFAFAFAGGLIPSIAVALPIIHVDFRAVQGTPGINWNTADIGTTKNLVDFVTGEQTGIDVSAPFNTTHSSPTWNGVKDWVVPDALRNGLSSSFGVTQVDVTFDGLTPGVYSLEVVSVSAANADINDITIHGNFADRNFNGTPGQFGDNWDPRVQGLINENWLIWDNVTAIGNQIIVRFESSSFGNNPTVSAIKLAQLSSASSPIPEPSTFVLLSIALLGGVFHRLIHRKQSA